MNARLLAYFAQPERVAHSVSAAKDRPSCAPADVDDAYMRLGSHPDLVARLWDELGARLPDDCRWVVYGTPALVHPRLGVVFGFCGGTQTYALRLPLALCASAVAGGAPMVREYPAYPELGIEASRLDLADLGEGWVFGEWRAQEFEWCRAAYHAAGLGS